MHLRALSGFLVAVLACAACAGGDDDGAAGTDSAFSGGKLSTEDSLELPFAEVSGLGARKIGGKVSFLAVGDKKHDILTFETSDKGKPKNFVVHDLSSRSSGGDSQWEAVAGDGDGRVFVLNEGEAEISVFGPDLDKDDGGKKAELIHTIKLDMPKDHELARSWNADANSRGEGMLLLENGHILIAKEKGPAALIEFAPGKQKAAGYNPTLALAGKKFPLESGKKSTYSPVAFWELNGDAAHVIGDIADLSLDDEGRILILTDQLRAIVRIERTLDPNEKKIDARDVFDLPGSIDKPEGLTFAAGKPLVAIDNKDKKVKALFQLSALR